MFQSYNSRKDLNEKCDNGGPGMNAIPLITLLKGLVIDTLWPSGTIWSYWNNKALNQLPQWNNKELIAYSVNKGLNCFISLYELPIRS